MRKERYAKVAQQGLIVVAHPHIFRLDVQVQHLLTMCIVQGRCYLLDICDNHRQGKRGSDRMALSQRTSRCIGHYQEGYITLYATLKYSRNVRVSEACQRTSFGKKAFLILL